MNKRLLTVVLSATLIVPLFISCAEEMGEYVRPVFGSIQCTPDPAIAGDSLELIIPHKVKGNGIAGTTYTWTIKDIGWDEAKRQPKDTVFTIDDNYDGYGKRDPRLKFLLPADCPVGNHQVTMKVTYSVYIGATLFDWDQVSGRIMVEER